MYYIYRHIIPNGKSYIGKTKDINKRFQNGKGYIRCPKFWKEIQRYGWESIKHQILYETEDDCEARKMEKIMIEKYNSIEDGYNTVNSTIIRRYKPKGKEKIFEKYDTNGNLLDTYFGTDELVKAGYIRGRILAHVKGRSKTTYGYVWKIKERKKEEKIIKIS